MPRSKVRESTDLRYRVKLAIVNSSSVLDYNSKALETKTPRGELPYMLHNSAASSDISTAAGKPVSTSKNAILNYIERYIRTGYLAKRRLEKNRNAGSFESLCEIYAEYWDVKPQSLQATDGCNGASSKDSDTQKTGDDSKITILETDAKSLWEYKCPKHEKQKTKCESCDFISKNARIVLNNEFEMAIHVLDYTFSNSAELYKVTDTDIAETFYEVGKWYGKIETQRLVNASIHQSTRPSPNDIWLLLSSIMEEALNRSDCVNDKSRAIFMSLEQIHKNISKREFKAKGATEKVCSLSLHTLDQTLRKHGIITRLRIRNGGYQEYSVKEDTGILYIDPDWKKWFESMASRSQKNKLSRQAIYVCETKRESSNGRERFRELLLCCETNYGPQTLFMMRLYRQKKIACSAFIKQVKVGTFMMLVTMLDERIAHLKEHLDVPNETDVKPSSTDTDYSTLLDHIDSEFDALRLFIDSLQMRAELIGIDRESDARNESKETIEVQPGEAPAEAYLYFCSESELPDVRTDPLTEELPPPSVPLADVIVSEMNILSAQLDDLMERREEINHSLPPLKSNESHFATPHILQDPAHTQNTVNDLCAEELLAMQVVQNQLLFVLPASISLDGRCNSDQYEIIEPKTPNNKYLKNRQKNIILRLPFPT